MADLTARVVNQYWPELAGRRVSLNPPRNGMDRFTGKPISGWTHVEQSLEVIFATPFHERVLRRWVGSFVPHILGRDIIERIITRFYWAICTAIDLWEPDYRVRQIFFMGSAIDTPAPSSATMDEEIRKGNVIFRQEGVYYPRGHLGDYTPYESRAHDIVSGTGEL